jgi:hypothetical protein
MSNFKEDLQPRKDSMLWSKIVLSDNQIAEGKTYELQEAFRRLWEALGAPMDMALYAEKTKGLSRTFFLTPACSDKARAVIVAYSAVPCAEPPPASLSLLIGHSLHP